MLPHCGSLLLLQGEIFTPRQSIGVLLTVAAENNLSLGPTYVAPGFASCFLIDIPLCSCGVGKEQNVRTEFLDKAVLILLLEI